MALTRFFATTDEIKAGLSELEANNALTYIQFAGADRFPTPSLPVFNTLLHGALLTQPTDWKEARSSYHVVPRGTEIESREVVYGIPVKGRFPWQKDRIKQQKGYDI